MGKKRPARKRSTSTPRTHLVLVSHVTFYKSIADVICEKLESSQVGVNAFRDDRNTDGRDSIPDVTRRRFVSAMKSLSR